MHKPLRGRRNIVRCSLLTCKVKQDQNGRRVELATISLGANAEKVYLNAHQRGSGRRRRKWVETARVIGAGNIAVVDFLLQSQTLID